MAGQYTKDWLKSYYNTTVVGSALKKGIETVTGVDVNKRLDAMKVDKQGETSAKKALKKMGY
jgi:hypothetical protein